MKRLSSGLAAAACALAVLTMTSARGAAAPPACDSDNGGIKLPAGRLLRAGRLKTEDNIERPSEALYRVEANANFGWPYCFHD